MDDIITQRPLLIGWPNSKVGGAGLYLLRVAEKLIERGQAVWVFDVRGGLISERLKGAEKVFISTIQKGWDIPAGCDVLLPVGYANEIGGMLRLADDCRICFLSMNEYELFSWHSWGFLYKWMGDRVGTRLPRFIEPIRNRKVRRMMRELNEGRAIHYVCGFNADYDRRIVGLEQPSFLPIPVPCYPQLTVEGKELELVWLSRLTESKVAGLKVLMKRLGALGRRIRVHVIGYGDQIDELKSLAVEFGLPIEIPGTLEGPRLHAYLAKTRPLCLGVGTSILELAAMGFPAVTTPLRGGRAGLLFKWVNELENFDMAISPFGKLEGHAFAEIWASAESDYTQQAEKCRRHVSMNFRAEDTAARLAGIPRSHWPLPSYFREQFKTNLLFNCISALKRRIQRSTLK
jgi:glycosyltransferase involved in cell wall biosynthesis